MRESTVDRRFGGRRRSRSGARLTAYPLCSDFRSHARGHPIEQQLANDAVVERPRRIEAFLAGVGQQWVRPAGLNATERASSDMRSRRMLYFGANTARSIFYVNPISRSGHHAPVRERCSAAYQ